MFTRNQAVRLLAFSAVYDQRTVGDEDADGWHLAGQIARWNYPAVQRIIAEHYSAGADRPRIDPATITDRLRAIRARAADSFEAPRIADALPNSGYPAWLRRQIAAHVDAIIDRWATTGEEPPRALPPAPARIRSLPELVAAAPPEHHPAVEAGARTLKARRVQLDPVRRAQALAELDRVRSAEPEPPPAVDPVDRARVRARIENEAVPLDHQERPA